MDQLDQQEKEKKAKVASLQTPSDVESQIDHAVRAIKGFRVPFLTWPAEAQRQLVRWLFGASGSLKNNPDIGIYVQRPERPDLPPKLHAYRWTAKGWWGDARAAIDYGDEGRENVPCDFHWTVPQKRLSEIAALAIEHQIVAPMLPLRKPLKSRKRSAKHRLKNVKHAGTRWPELMCPGTFLRRQ